MFKVIDVSNYDPTVNWSLVKADTVDGVYAKATEGLAYNDAMFLNHVAGAKSVGIPVGAYHFAHPQNDPVAEAKHFVSVISGSQLDLIPVLDIEEPTTVGVYTSAYLVNWIKRFATYVTSQLNVSVMLYTYVGYIQLHSLSGLSDMPLWIADYGVPTVPQCSDWKTWALWQYTDSGTVQGISGKVDISHAVSMNALKGVDPVDTVKILVNGKTFPTDGVMVGGNTMVPWTVLREFGADVKALSVDAKQYGTDYAFNFTGGTTAPVKTVTVDEKPVSVTLTYTDGSTQTI